ncbi:15-hydroxyprostaglandin dehydrogenase [NAD(+)]-like [Dreissena polymorpha]|uniref:15-hydroxyprostaglandin dehydrogenase [NAD(+)] n=3 Tax=Dreissena polymorpha TaxID=45954 RepID=A0A9D4II09_DREPO|nr:15-hydroxyprostaglandin dehydrogenase [NAD(+)]-like [Dreissena polymorpha]XP_052231760.1 15-hydroxyprostaglandin dehydrogenase [NAD(+)]-like [Dreissena polymorpha]XP_052231761.1 15-hydroxyprostaglandin dehydrogenase [NAD(+)]-like [Dreissena polymorpha]XP_052231762.1 15-hydroxyprostaglandin dehydrogenase [NAD(+)]-like [Dreissena polymorpha]XP_052231764.1 15-hydroxyprostaglandin dehydrogenase [NAD(+)]-like [Dreissena polymorpha]KAH3773272.1 hypothetical protein DPMN_174631 [Dreissena polymorp
MHLVGKVALVTGGASGMGRGFAEALLKAAAKVCIADFNAETGVATELDLRQQYGHDNVMFSKCNITSATEFEAVFKQTKEAFGGIDIVVNNAGIGGETDEKWEQTVNVNMKGTLRGLRLAMYYLSVEHGGRGGCIVNVASMAGLNPNPFSPVYGCTKAGIIHATRCYAVSEAAKKSNIRLNVMCPAFVDTPMFRQMAAGDASQTIGGDQTAVNAFIERIGVLSTEDVSAALIDILTDETRNGLILRCAKKTGNVYSTLTVQDV